MTKTQKEAEAKQGETQKEAIVKTKATKGVAVILNVRYGNNVSGDKITLPKEKAEQFTKDGYAKKA